MDESGIDMGFDLAALTNAEDFDLEYNDFEQALSLLSTSQDFMYYELKSRAPDTGRYVNVRVRWHQYDEYLRATLSLSPVEHRAVLSLRSTLLFDNIQSRYSDGFIIFSFHNMHCCFIANSSNFLN